MKIGQNPYKAGDIVAFSRRVLERTQNEGAAARGIVVGTDGRFARVDWRGTWIPREDGSTVRSIPAVNLRRA